MAKKLENPYVDRDMDLDRPAVLSNGKKPKKKPSSKSVWNKLRPFLTFIISLSLVVLIVFGVVNYVKEHYFDPVDANDSTTIEVEIPKNSSLSTIADILYENNLIRNKQVFKLYVDFSDMSSKLKAGTYELSPDMTFDDIVYTLQEGNVADAEIDIQFIEGRTVEEYGKKLVENYGILKNTDHYLELAKTGGDFVNEYPFLAEAKAKDDARPADQRRYYLLEGYLAPDTYRYLTSATEEDLIRKQLDQFSKILSMKKEGEELTYQERAEELGMSVDDMVTLASIIEREASSTDYFAKVSAVFHNRLNDRENFGYLDSDATQAYGLGITGRLNLIDSELTTPTPYNTKWNGAGTQGLPAGPIGNPGRAAIEAALYPDEALMQDGDQYYYFRATDIEKGDMEFVHTNEELEALKAQWQDEWARIDAEASAKAAGGQ